MCREGDDQTAEQSNVSNQKRHARIAYHKYRVPPPVSALRRLVAREAAQGVFRFDRLSVEFVLHPRCAGAPCRHSERNKTRAFASLTSDARMGDGHPSGNLNAIRLLSAKRSEIHMHS